MSRENRGLLINFGILLVVSFLFLLGYGVVSKNEDLKQELKTYQVYFSEATDFNVVDVDSTVISEKVEIIKDGEVIGYYFEASSYATGIPGHDGEAELKLQVVLDKNGVFKHIETLYSEHTPSFVEKLDNYYTNATSKKLADFRNIDGAAGASEYSQPAMNAILAEIAKSLGITVNPMIPKDPYVLVFGNYARKEADTTFTPTEVLLSKEFVYNELNQVIGVAYVGTGKAVLHDYDETQRTFNLIVGLDLSGKFLGFAPFEHEHTPAYVSYLDPYFARLTEVNVADYAGVDAVVSPTAARTMSVVQPILAAIKAEFKPIASYGSVFGTYSQLVDDVDFEPTTTIVKRQLVLNSLNQVIGYAYFLTGTKALHDYDETLKRFNFMLGVGLDGNILGTAILENEHTTSYVTNLLPYLESLKGVNVNSYTDVDDVAGATMTLSVIKAALAEVKANHVAFDFYQYVSEAFETIEDDSTFTATDVLLEKKVLKNSNGDVTGYVYVGTDGIDGIPRHEAGVEDFIKLAVGVDTTGKITGVYIVESEHTVSFVSKVVPYLNSLVGVDIKTYTTTYNNGEADVDGFAGASDYTKPVIVNILDAIKGVA